MIRLYELAGAEDSFRFSPFCWRTRIALAHKGLTAEGIPWRFTEKEALPTPNEGRVPVLEDNGRVIHDSWQIAAYLETEYPQAASLFGPPAARALTSSIRFWADQVLHKRLAPVVLMDVFHLLHPKDQSYFRRTREAALGKTLEAIAAGRAEHQKALDETLMPMRSVLENQPFLAGDAPLYADYILWGELQWATMVSSKPLMDATDPLARWFKRLGERFPSLGAS